MTIERILNLSITETYFIVYDILLHCIVMHNMLKDYEAVTGRFLSNFCTQKTYIK